LTSYHHGLDKRATRFLGVDKKYVVNGFNPNFSGERLFWLHAYSSH